MHDELAALSYLLIDIALNYEYYIISISLFSLCNYIMEHISIKLTATILN